MLYYVKAHNIILCPAISFRREFSQRKICFLQLGKTGSFIRFPSLFHIKEKTITKTKIGLWIIQSSRIYVDTQERITKTKGDFLIQIVDLMCLHLYYPMKKKMMMKEKECWERNWLGCFFSCCYNIFITFAE